MYKLSHIGHTYKVNSLIRIRSVVTLCVTVSNGREKLKFGLLKLLKGGQGVLIFTFKKTLVKM